MPLLDNNYNAGSDTRGRVALAETCDSAEVWVLLGLFFKLITLQYKEQQQWGEFKVNKIKLKTQTKSEKLIIK